MDLSVITVTWNSEKYIAEQIRSVFLGCEKISFEQIIIDNGSGDKTLELIKNFPEVKLIGNNCNAGFAAANNQGAKIAGGRYLLFLNPDMRVEKGSLDKMIGWMDKNPQVGIASCKLINEKGEFNLNASPRRFPTFWNQLFLILKVPHLFPGLMNRYHYRDFDPGKDQEVDSVRGSFMFVRREIVEKLGFAFDPRYFIWFEDVDLCREARRLGYKVFYAPIISCVDLVGRAFKQSNSYENQKRFTESMLKYFKKWEPRYKWAILALVRPIGLAMAWIYSKVC